MAVDSQNENDMSSSPFDRQNTTGPSPAISKALQARDAGESLLDRIDNAV